MTLIQTDLLVIGAGSGGLSVAAGAAQMGADVTLLEGHRMGGDCLNYGCVPSKALLHGAASGMDWRQAHDHVMNTIATIAPHDSVERFEGLGCRVIQEYGRFLSPTKVQAGGYIVSARRIVIATGSSPIVPPIPGLEDVPFETNETIFDLPDAPDHLLIIGGGAIGMEMAQAHRRLGCKVSVIEGATALGSEDPECAALVTDRLRNEGVTIEEGALVTNVSGRSENITVQCADGRTATGTHLLVAAGRRANTDRLDLDKAGINTTRSGITVDKAMKTSNKRVYAIGDAVGGLQFTHVAGYHAGVIIRSAVLGLPGKVSHSHVPHATYTDPELAQIGPTEQAARRLYGARLKVARFDYAGNDRAIATRQTQGFIKVMVVRGRPIGVSIVGPQAGEHIALWSLAMANKLKMSQVSAMIAPYPTIAEISKRAAGAYFAPRLFDNKIVKRVVRIVQRWLP